MTFPASVLALATILVFNQDDSQLMNEPRSREFLRDYVDEVCRGPVTHFFMCPNAMRCNIPSDVFEPHWLALEEQPALAAKKVGKAWALKTMFDSGVDPYAIWAGRCREKGVSPWLTMRMNDVHCVDNPEYGGLSRFWRTHPEFRRNASAPPRQWGDHAFDYAHKEVRDHHLAFVKTCLERYDVDGFETDWMRFPVCLRAGHEREDGHFITDFMREVRRLADAAAKRLGHPVKVGARVPSDPDGALGIGLDAVGWAKAGLVDWIVPCNFLVTADMLLPYAEWRRRIGKMQVTVVPGLDYAAVKEGGGGIPQPLTAAEYRGFADSVYAEGAPGVYLFNLFVTPKETSAWGPVLSQGLAPETVARHDRSYYTSYHENSLPGGRGFQAPVPLTEERTVRFRIGAPAVSGTRPVVHLAFSAAVPEAVRGRVTLNGVAAVKAVEEKPTVFLPEKTASAFALKCVFPVGTCRAGMNHVTIPACEGVVLRAGELSLKGERK